MYPQINTNISNGMNLPSPSTDGVCGLVINSPATAQLPLNTSVKITSLLKVESLGITAAYDTTNGVLTYYHVSEFFRNGGSVLWLRLHSTTALEAAFTGGVVQQLINDVPDGTVGVVAVGVNPAGGGFNSTATFGLTRDFYTTLPLAQTLATTNRIYNKPLRILLEARNFNGTVLAAQDLRAYFSMAPYCDAVMPVIGQDMDVAALNPRYQHHACVGTALGLVSRAKVSECIGWVQKFDMRSENPIRFAKIGLSNNLPIGAYTEADKNMLHAKGYNYLINRVGSAGVYFNSDNVIAPATHDYYCLANGRTIDKVQRQLYAALLPHINKPTTLLPNGRMQPQEINFFESLCAEKLESMKSVMDISQYQIYIDPMQIIIINNTLVIQVRIIPVGKTEYIMLNLVLNRNF